MDLARMRQIETVFAAVSALPREQWPEALAQRCGGDTDLRRQVELMLAVGGTTHAGPLDRPPTAAAGLAAAAPPIDAGSAPLVKVGATVGKYELLAMLGEGGMGVVYRARQTRPSREVALKVIRPGLATPAMLRRFEFEAEMLGRLQHPGIAQIIEAGTFDTGLGPQPYFAMELVSGGGTGVGMGGGAGGAEPARTLLDHCNRAGLDQRARIELFRRVCDAVEHAHQRGVIHRDLKPGNILVDGAGQPKILDFGVARAVESPTGGQPAAQITVIATGERPLIGTLAYMSPEQVEGDPSRIDTRTDVYALGVILYQLVSGQLPHDLTGKALQEALRTVTEADPPSLSTVISSAKGDLETIASKALEKERERRYQSAAALSEDLRRFLSDEPIAARPPSTWYQVRKFARRNRALVGGGSLALVALVGGLTATAIGFAEASRERDAARAALERQKTTAGLLKDVLSGVDPEVARGRDNFVLRRMLDDWAARVDKDLAKQPEDQHELRLLIGRTYNSLSQFDRAEPLLRAALADAEKRWGAGSEEAALCRGALADTLAQSGRFADAEALAGEAVTALETLKKADTLAAAEALTTQAFAIGRQGRDEEALAIHRRVQGIVERAVGQSSREALSSRADIAMTLVNIGKYDESIAMMEGVLSEARAALGPDSPGLVRYLQDTAIAYYRADKFERARALQEEALALVRRVVPGDSRMAVNSLDQLNTLASSLGDSSGMDRYSAESLEMKRRIFGERSLEVSQSYYDRAHALLGREKMTEALDLVEKAYTIAKEVAPESLGFRDTLYLKGQILGAMGRQRDAEPVLRELLGEERKVSSPDSRDPIMTAAALGSMLTAEGWKDLDTGDAAGALGRAKEAEALLSEAEAFFVRMTSEKQWRRDVAIVNRATARALLAACGVKAGVGDAGEAAIVIERQAKDAESAFESAWSARAEIAAGPRVRVLKGSAKNISRIARAGVLASAGDTTAAARWVEAEKRWNERVEEVGRVLEGEMKKGP